jgi:hemolysin activation/secretion protein
MGTDKFDAGLVNGGIAYALPLGGSGVRAEIAAERTTYELGGEYRELESTGRTDALRANFSVPIIRSVEQNLWLRYDIAYKRIVEQIGAFDIENHKYSLSNKLSARYDRWFKIQGESRLYTTAGLGLTAGMLHLYDSEAREIDEVGAFTEGAYSYLSFDIAANYTITPQWSINAAFTAQKTIGPKNMDGSEQFIASGPSGIRAYRETISGDNGYVLKGELRYHLPTIDGKFHHSLGLFSGIGKTDYADASARNTTGDTIYDAGLGYYANCEPFFLKAQIAQILGKKPEGIYSYGRTQFLVQFGASF